MGNAAIQILIYKPVDPPVPEHQRGVVVNPRLKQRFKSFVPVGVYLEGSDLQYYFFDDCDKSPKIYGSLDKLKQDLPDPDIIFNQNPKLFIMGHGNGGYYGLGNCHGPGEQIYDNNFDKLLSDFKKALPENHDEVFVTLEGCNTDSQMDASANNQTKTFLARVSEKHPEITFAGTGPWDVRDGQTGFRSLAPDAPITSMAGNIWRAGNSVIFYHDQYQIALRKPLFSSTETARALKVNTVEYARAVLAREGQDELIKKIALSRDILKIQDLKTMDGFPELSSETDISVFFEREKQILAKEQENYLASVRDILSRADPIEQLTDRDIIELLLGLKEPSVFKGQESLLESILTNRELLGLAMVSCGKVLVGGPDNDGIIDLLLKHGADINSADKNGMTALHYVAQNFYNYRKEPLNLIKKLLEYGATLELRNREGQTPYELAEEHSKDGRVSASNKLLAALKQDKLLPTPLELKQSFRQIFQMSQHKADELLSLPYAKREYGKCSEGTLYIPEDAVEKLLGILHFAKSNEELLLAFELEFNMVITALERGYGTGSVIDNMDEFVPKCFGDANQRLAPVINALEMKQEMIAAKFAENHETGLYSIK